jgi:hypothetical protein
MNDPNLEVQGQKCKKYYPAVHTQKKSIQVSIAFESPEPEKINTAVFTNFPSPINHRGIIVLSSELPSVPYYMPKMLSKTPSPLRLTRSRFNNLRLNMYAPYEIKGSDEGGYSQKGNKKLSRSINIAGKSTGQYQAKKKHKKFLSTEIKIRLPTVTPRKIRNNQ